MYTDRYRLRMKRRVEHVSEPGGTGAGPAKRRAEVTPPIGFFQPPARSSAPMNAISNRMYTVVPIIVATITRGDVLLRVLRLAAD